MSDISEPDNLSKFGQWKARVWESPADGNLAPEDYPEISFGEEQVWDEQAGWLENLTERPNFGLCFSGGGNRASTAGFGLMRALVQMEAVPAGQTGAVPFIDRFRYTSGVSGGNWFLKSYTFVPDNVPEFGADSFFGNHQTAEPRIVDETTTDQQLHAAREVEVQRIRQALYGNDISTVFENLADIAEQSRFLRGVSNKSYWFWWIFDGLVSEVTDYFATQHDPQDPDDTQITRADEAWTRQNIGPLLSELGLYGWQDGENMTNKLFTWNAASRQAILDRNPQFSEDDFVMVERRRPFSIMGVSAFDNPHGTLSAAGLGLEGILMLQLEQAFGLDPDDVTLWGEIVKDAFEDMAKQAWPFLGRSQILDWTATHAQLKDAAQLEFTPLYVGAASLVNNIGGGFTESFATDRDYLRDADSGGDETHVVVRGNLPQHQNLTIADTMGMASAAIGLGDISRGTNVGNQIFGTQAQTSPFWEFFIGGEGVDFGTPEHTHFPATNRSSSRTLNGIDGGYLENLGIFPLLRRRMDRIVVGDMRGAPTHPRRRYEATAGGTQLVQHSIVNVGGGSSTQTFQTLVNDSGEDDDTNHNDDETLMKGSAVSHLFGEHYASTDIAYVLGRYKNQVFDNEPVNGVTPFEQLRTDMRANYERYGVAFCTGRYRVLRNPNYGINLDDDDYWVEIFWYFLDSAPVWSTVTSEILDWLGNDDIDLPQRPIPRPISKRMKVFRDSFRNIPNIATDRTNLTDYEAALMGMYGEWAFRKIEEPLREFLFE